MNRGVFHNQDCYMVIKNMVSMNDKATKGIMGGLVAAIIILAVLTGYAFSLIGTLASEKRDIKENSSDDKCIPAPHANLSGCDFANAYLVGADLTGTRFIGANLTRANFHGANFHGADFTNATLVGANLFGANLFGANLVGADLTNTNLFGANLFGADLTGCIGYSGCVQE